MLMTPTQDEVTLRAIGARVRRLRNARNLSMEKLAEMVDCHLQTVGRWERGEQSMSFIDALKLSHALKAPLAQIAGMTKDPSEVPMVREGPMYFLDRDLYERVRKAKSVAELSDAFVIPVAIRLEPDDMEISQQQYDAIWQELNRNLARLR